MKRALLAICLVSGCAHRTPPAGAAAEGTAPPTRLSVRFRPVEQNGGVSRAELTLENHDARPLLAAGWKLCFSFAAPIRDGGAPGLAPALAAQGLSLTSAGDYRTLA